MSHIVYIIH